LPPDRPAPHLCKADRAARMEAGAGRVPHALRPARRRARVPGLHRRARRRGDRAGGSGSWARADDLDRRRTPHVGRQRRRRRLTAQAWGARRAWFLINGASQGNLAAGLALAHRGPDVVVQRNAHSSVIDALVLAGLRPTYVAPELDAELGIAHCLSERALERA